MKTVKLSFEDWVESNLSYKEYYDNKKSLSSNLFFPKIEEAKIKKHIFDEFEKCKSHFLTPLFKQCVNKWENLPTRNKKKSISTEIKFYDELLTNPYDNNEVVISFINPHISDQYIKPKIRASRISKVWHSIVLYDHPYNLYVFKPHHSKQFNDRDKCLDVVAAHAFDDYIKYLESELDRIENPVQIFSVFYLRYPHWVEPLYKKLNGKLFSCDFTDWYMLMNGQTIINRIQLLENSPLSTKTNLAYFIQKICSVSGYKKYVWKPFESAFGIKEKSLKKFNTNPKSKNDFMKSFDNFISSLNNDIDTT